MDNQAKSAQRTFSLTSETKGATLVLYALWRRAIVSLYTTSRSVGCEFQICNLMGPVKRIFDVTRLLDAFENCGAYLTKMP